MATLYNGGRVKTARVRVELLDDYFFLLEVGGMVGRGMGEAEDRATHEHTANSSPLGTAGRERFP